MIQAHSLITLSNGGRYLLIDEINEVEGQKDKRFFFSMGVNPDDTLDHEDTIFLAYYKNNFGDYVMEKVDETSDLYTSLSLMETISVAMDNIPGYTKKLEEEIEKLQQESSQ